MYYVNEEQIDARLRFVPTIVEALEALARDRDESGAEAALLAHFAQERALQLAVEAVTDVGSMLIDGFMMRDASSYEDIIDVLQGEGVLTDEAADGLKSLVALRRPLMQEYMDWPRTGTPLRGDLGRIAELLGRFPPLVEAFVAKELRPFGRG